MKQILQNLRSGATQVEEIPRPALHANQLLIRSTRSLVSAGTERMLVEFGRAGWLDKARQQPDKVRAVLDKMATDGILPTIDAVFSKLDQPLPLGYCNVGEVLEVGSAVGGFSRGDRVASNGRHAEVVSVSANLCARIPPAVTDDEAAFTVPASIALQSIRLLQPTLGETVVVAGLGLIGQLCVQLLRAHGCRVMGVDLAGDKIELARRFGAEGVDLSAGEDPVAAAVAFSRGRGVDAVVVAAATGSSEPVHQAARMCRKRGRIVLVGVTGLELRRDDFYEKELSFQVSCSYGPGRYDPQYEERGIDYPPGFVRWTAQRNFEAVLDMMAAKRIDTLPLISHRFALERAAEVYELLTRPASAALGILLEYPAAARAAADSRTIQLRTRVEPRAGAAARVAFIGAGNHAGRTLIPAFAAAGARLAAIASASGVTAAHYARKFGLERASTDAGALITAGDVDAVVIATRHDSHPHFVARALEAGKHVFVEKPLAVSSAGLDTVEASWHAGRDGTGAAPLLMVGFNRRFAPHARCMRGLLARTAAAKGVVVTVNAGSVPATHWIHDPAAGGGRLIGEGCHFIDLARFLIGHPIVEARVTRLGATQDAAGADTFTVTLGFSDGSWASIQYLANGHPRVAKERVEVFCAGRVLQLDNFRRLRGYGWPGFRALNLWRQDKGQEACARAFLEALRGGPVPVPFEEIMEVSRVTVALGEAARG